MQAQQLIDAGLFHSIHTSERKAFRACRRRWDWAYRQNYHPVVMPKPLEFGIAWHVAMETWYAPDEWNNDRAKQADRTLAEFVRTVNEQYMKYVELNGVPNDEIMKDYDERVDLGIKMVKYYTTTVSPLLDKELKPLAVEIPFEVPLDLWCKCEPCRIRWNEYALKENNIPIVLHEFDHVGAGQFEIYWEKWQGLPVTFGGRIDAIMEDFKGRLLVFDWKTTTRILDGEDESAFLELDDQVGGYPAAMYKLGRPVDGFIYHEQRKGVPEPPERLKRAYKGKLFSTNKNAAVEYNTFLYTVMQEDTHAYNYGMYDEYLQFLSSPMAPKFYQRHTVYKTNQQMENFWEDLRQEAQDILGQPRIYPQPSRFSCNSCLYRQPCEGKNRGEDYEYTLDSMYIRERS